MSTKQSRPLPITAPFNLFEAPGAEVADIGSDAGTSLYVVAPRKFLLLFVGTLGMYQVYWFYKHWAQLNLADRRYWPIARAIFSVFFTHKLFAAIDQSLQRAHVRYSWPASGMATLVVVAIVIHVVASRLTAAPALALVGVAITYVVMALIGYALYTAQGAANVACGDPNGDSNRGMTAANIVWLVIGAVLWLLNLAGIYALLTGNAGVAR